MSWLEQARKKCGMTLEEAGRAINKTSQCVMNYQKDPMKLRLEDFFNLYRAVGTDSKEIMKKAINDELAKKF